MSGFSAEWLALREPADERARNGEVATSLAARFALRDSIRVVDLGCGAGSNLRATSPLLPKRQHWTLVDYDETLLAAARTALIRWADVAHEHETGVLELTSGERNIHVEFRRVDLAANIDAALDGPVAPDLVTAAAFFDLASADFIRRVVQAVAKRRAVFHTVLTYNGFQHWTPRQPSDGQMTQAFNRHQMTDKGFGASAGPTAPVELAEQLELAGYSVIEGQSPWLLTAAHDARLIGELVAGQAAAVRETKAVDAVTVERWERVTRTGAEVGHVDTLGLPPPDMGAMDEEE
jgi:SAM-dependent methyltransferase